MTLFCLRTWVLRGRGRRRTPTATNLSTLRLVLLASICLYCRCAWGGLSVGIVKGKTSQVDVTRRRKSSPRPSGSHIGKEMMALPREVCVYLPLNFVRLTSYTNNMGANLFSLISSPFLFSLTTSLLVLLGLLSQPHTRPDVGPLLFSIQILHF